MTVHIGTHHPSLSHTPPLIIISVDHNALLLQIHGSVKSHKLIIQIQKTTLSKQGTRIVQKGAESLQLYL